MIFNYNNLDSSIWLVYCCIIFTVTIYSSTIVANGNTAGYWISLATTTQCRTPLSISINNNNGLIYAVCNGYSSACTGITDEILYSECIQSKIISINYNGSIINTITTSSQCPGPLSISFNNNNGLLYAVCENGNFGGSVIAINGSTVTKIANSSQCPYPTRVDVNSLTGIVYVACTGISQNYGAYYTDGRILSINGSIVSIIANCAGARSVHVNILTGIVYAACSPPNEGLIAINGSNITIIATPTQCSVPQDIYSNSLTGIVYAACRLSGIISIIGSTVRSIASSPQCLFSHNVDINPHTGIIYATCANWNSNGPIISINDSSIPATINLFANGNQCLDSTVYVDKFNNHIYASCTNTGIIIFNQSYCPIGYYCNSVLTKCSIGSYCSDIGMTDPLPCDAGSYCPENGLSSPGPICPAGSYCPSGSSAPILCPIGVYGSETGLISALCTGSCPSTIYCAAGSTSIPIVPIVPGNTISSGSDNTVKNAIIGSCVSGGVGLLFFMIKMFLDWKARKNMQKVLDGGNTDTDKEQIIYYREILRPITNKIFENIRTTGLLGYRNSNDTLAYINSIETIIAKIGKLGVNIHLKNLPSHERTLLLNIISQSVRLFVGKNYSICSINYLGSFFKPEVTPIELINKSDSIAMAVLNNINHNSTIIENINIKPSLVPMDNNINQPVHVPISAAVNIPQSIDQTAQMQKAMADMQKQVEMMSQQIRHLSGSGVGAGAGAGLSAESKASN